MGTPRRRTRDIRRWILESLRPKELDGRAVSQADCSLPSKDLRRIRYLLSGASVIRLLSPVLYTGSDQDF